METNELFDQMYPTNNEKIALGVSVLVPVIYNLGAMWAAHKGQYDKALYRAVAWGVASANLHRSLNFRYKQIANQLPPSTFSMTSR